MKTQMTGNIFIGKCAKKQFYIDTETIFTTDFHVVHDKAKSSTSLKIGKELFTRKL